MTRTSGVMRGESAGKSSPNAERPVSIDKKANAISAVVRWNDMEQLAGV